MWIANSTQDVLKSIEWLNVRKRAAKVSTFDFSTLYTAIPHDNPKEAISWVIMEGFADHKREKKYNFPFRLRIYENSKDAQWTKNPKKGIFSVNETKLIGLIDILLDNIYTEWGGKVLKQILGIPMGTDCAPFLVNLFLHYYEFKWICSKLQGVDIENEKARKSTHNKRFQDDLITFKCVEFDRYKYEIYMTTKLTVWT